MKLAPQPGYTFSPLTAAADLDAFAPHGALFEMYDVALNVGEPIDRALLGDLIAQQDVFVWRMEPDDKAHEVAFACLSRFAMAEQVYVFCPAGWDNTAVAAGLEALTQAVFAQAPRCQDIWTCVLLPEPEDAEDTLLIMGFTYTPASLDKGRRRTFGLSKEIFAAYHAD